MRLSTKLWVEDEAIDVEESEALVVEKVVHVKRRHTVPKSLYLSKKKISVSERSERPPETPSKVLENY